MTQRILVVEDDATIADAVGYALREAGYEVDTVGDGGGAVESARGPRRLQTVRSVGYRLLAS